MKKNISGLFRSVGFFGRNKPGLVGIAPQGTSEDNSIKDKNRIKPAPGNKSFLGNLMRGGKANSQLAIAPLEKKDDDLKSDIDSDDETTPIFRPALIKRQPSTGNNNPNPKGATNYYADRAAFLESLTVNQKLEILTTRTRSVALRKYFNEFAKANGSITEPENGLQTFTDSFPTQESVTDIVSLKDGEADLIKATITAAKENQLFADKADKSFALETAEAYASYLFANPNNFVFSLEELQKASTLYSDDVKTEKKDDFIEAFTQACAGARDDIVQHVASLTTNGNVRLISNDLISEQLNRDDLDAAVERALAEAVSIDPEVNNTPPINEAMNVAIARIANADSIIELGNADVPAVNDEALKKQEHLKRAAAALTKKGATLSKQAKVAAIEKGNLAIIAAIEMADDGIIEIDVAAVNNRIGILIDDTTLDERKKEILKGKAAALTQADEVISIVPEEKEDDEFPVQAEEKKSITEKLILISKGANSLQISDRITFNRKTINSGTTKKYEFLNNGEPLLTIKIYNNNEVNFHQNNTKPYLNYIENEADLDAALARFYNAKAQNNLLLAAQSGDLANIESSITAYENEKAFFEINANTHLNLDEAFVAASKLKDAANSQATIENLYKISVTTTTAISKEALLEAIQESTKAGHADIANILLGNASTTEVTLIEPGTPFEKGDLLTILEEAVKQEDRKDKTAIIGYLVTKDPTIRNEDAFKDAFIEAAKSGHVATVEALYAASLNAASSSINADKFLAAAKGAISDAPEATKLDVTNALISHLSNEIPDDKVVLNQDQLSEILTAAARSGNVEVINAVYGASLNPLDATTPSKLTATNLKDAIKAAATSGKADAVTALLEKANATTVAVNGKILIDEVELNTTLNESFTEAVKSKDRATVAAVYARSVITEANLVEANRTSTINEATLLGSLKIASKAGNNDIVTDIISHVSLDADENGKVNVAAVQFNEALGVSFALAASEGKNTVFGTLLGGGRKDVLTLDAGSMELAAANGLNDLNDEKQSKVLLAAADKGLNRVVVSLIAKYPALNLDDALLETSKKSEAANAGHRLVIATLAATGRANLTKKDSNGDTALHFCVRKQDDITNPGDAIPDHINALFTSVDHIFAANDAGETPLVELIRSDKKNLAASLITKAGTLNQSQEQTSQLASAALALTTESNKTAFLDEHAKKVASSGISALKEKVAAWKRANRVASFTSSAPDQAQLTAAISTANQKSLTELTNRFNLLLNTDVALGTARDIKKVDTETENAYRIVKQNTRLAGPIYQVTAADGTVIAKITTSSKDATKATVRYSIGNALEKSLDAASNDTFVTNLNEIYVALAPVFKSAALEEIYKAANTKDVNNIDKALVNYETNKAQFNITETAASSLNMDILFAKSCDSVQDLAVIKAIYNASIKPDGSSSVTDATILKSLVAAAERGTANDVKIADLLLGNVDTTAGKRINPATPFTKEKLLTVFKKAVQQEDGNNKTAIIGYLVAKNPDIRNEEAFKKAFIAAAKAGHAETVKALYDASGVNPSTIDAGTLSQALTAASIAGHVDAVNLLLGNVNRTGATIAANPALTADILRAAFVETAKVKSTANLNSAEVVSLLVAKDVANLGNTLKTHEDFSKAFIDQSKAGNIAVVDALFTASLDATNAATASTLTADHLSQAIIGAAESGKSDILEDLLGKISSPADKNGKVTLTAEELSVLVNHAFLEASKTGNKDAVEALFDISVRSTTSTAAADKTSSIEQDTLLKSLKEASKQGHTNVIDFFISKTKSRGNNGDFDISFEALNKAIGVSFVLAAANDKSDAINSLLAGKNSTADKAAALGTVALDTADINKVGNRIDSLSPDQQTKVLLVASANGLPQIIEPLLTKYSATIRIDEKDAQGNTTLYNSIAGQTADISSADLDRIPKHIKALIEGGATLTDKDIVKALDDNKPNLASAMIAKAIEVDAISGIKKSATGDVIDATVKDKADRIKEARSNLWEKDLADIYTSDFKAARTALSFPETTAAYVAKFREKTASEQLITGRETLAKAVQPSKSLFASAPKKALNKFDQGESAKIKELFSLITTEGKRIYDPNYTKKADSYEITQGPTSMGGTIYKVKKGSAEILGFTIPGSSSQAHFSRDGGKTKTLLTPANKNDVIEILKPIYKNDAQNDLLNAATKHGEGLVFVYAIFEGYQTNKKKFGIETNDNLDLNSAFIGACAAGHLDIAKYLYEQSVSTNRGVVTSSITDKSLLQAIEKAASDGRLDMIEVLLGNKNVSEAKTVEDAGATKNIAAKAVLGVERITQSQILKFIENAATKGVGDKDRSEIIKALYNKFAAAAKNTPQLNTKGISAELSKSLSAAASAGNSDVVKLLLGESEVDATGKKVEATYTPELLSDCIIKASKHGHAEAAGYLLDKLSTTTLEGKVTISLPDLSKTLSKSFVNAAANNHEAAVDALALRIKTAELVDIDIDEETLKEIKASDLKTQILANVLEASAAKGFRKIVTAVANQSEAGSVDAKAKDKDGRAIKETPLYNCVKNLSSDITDVANLPPEIEALIEKGADIFAVCKISNGHELTASNTPIHQAIQDGRSNLAAKMVARAREVKMKALIKTQVTDAIPEDDSIAFDNAANAALDKKASTTITQQAAEAFETDHAARVRLNEANILKTAIKSKSRSTAATLTPGFLRTKTEDEKDLKKVTTESNEAVIAGLKLCFDAIELERNGSTKFPLTITGSILAEKPKFEISYNKASTLNSESYVIKYYSNSSAKPAKTTITLNKEDGYLVSEGIVVSDAKGTRKLDEKSVSNFIRNLKDIYIAKKQDRILEAASKPNKEDLVEVLNGFNANKKQFGIAEETLLDLREAYLVAKVNGSTDVISILEQEPYELTEEKVFGVDGLGEAKISSYLPVAAKNKQYDLLERLFGMGDGDSNPRYTQNIDMPDSSGNTTIYYLLSEKEEATQIRVNKLTKNLLLFANDVNFQCQDGDTALHAAIKSENYEVAPRIITMMVGKDIDLNIRNNSRETAFDLIARIPDKTLRENLLAQSAEAIHTAPNLNRGRDLLAASRTGHPELLTYLAGKYLTGTSAIHVRDDNNNTPLHYISSQKSSDQEKPKATLLATHALLEKGAQPFFQGKDGNTALHLALKAENYDLASLMISKVNALGKINDYDPLKNFKDIKNNGGETVNDLVDKIKDPQIKADLESFIYKKKVMSEDEVTELVGTLPQVKAKSEGHEAADRLKLKSAAVKGFTGTNTAHVGASEGLNTVINPAPLPPTTVPGNASTVKSPPPKPPKTKAASTSQGNHSTSSVDLKAAVEALSKDPAKEILKGSSGANFTAEEAVKIKLSSVQNKSGADLQLSGKALELAKKGIIKKAVVAARNETAGKKVVENATLDTAERFLRTKYNGIDFTASKSNSFANCEFSGSCTFGNIGSNGNKFVNCTFGDDCIPTLPIVAGQFKAENFSQCKFTEGFLDKLGVQRAEFMKALKLNVLITPVEGVYTSMTTAEAKEAALTPVQIVANLPSSKPKQPIESFTLMANVLGRAK